MINKNVLFPVDTEAYHVIFSSQISTIKNFFAVITVFRENWVSELENESLPLRQIPVI